MTEKALKQCIREVVKKNFLGKKVKFQTSADEWESFKVVSYKIHSRKSIGVERCEFDDYGIDEDTQKFVVVEFWDAENEYDVLGCVCCIFTINKKGQIGTCDGPYSFELTVAYDTAIKMVGQIMEIYKEIGKPMEQIRSDQKLTEFEEAVYTQLVSAYDGDFNPKDPTAGGDIKLICNHLLSIARKQIQQEYIAKACMYLNEHREGFMTDEYIVNFRKAMED